MKMALRYSLFGLLIYVIALLILFPADRAYTWLQQRYSLPVQLYQLSGSVWSGRVGMARVAGVDIKDIEWRFHTMALLTGRMELGLGLGQEGAEAPLAMTVGASSDGSLYVHNDDELISVRDLERLFNPQPFGLTGSINVDLGNIHFKGPRPVQIAGEILWRDAGLDDILTSSVGDLLMTIETRNDVVEVTIKDQGGALGLDGLLMLMPDNSYRLTMTLQSRDRSRSDLRQMVSLLGTVSPEGKVTMSRRGRLNISSLLR